MKEKIKFQSYAYYADEDSKEIIDIAKKRGIQIPSVHLSLFKTPYAKIEEPNLNNIRLGREAVHKALPGLIGAQVNFEHMGIVCGSIVDAWINANDEIEVVYSFFKSVFPDENEKSIELAKQGKLSVSFELLAERDSQEKLEDGTIRLNDIDFTGCGHLMTNPPAFSDAKIYEYAKAVKERLSHCDDRELVCASVIEKQCDEILASDHPDEEPMMPENLFLITTTEHNHFHVAQIDFDGNGSTISTMGTESNGHIHKIVNWQIQTDNNDHAHRILDEIMAKVKDEVYAYRWKSNITNRLPDSSFAVLEPDYINGKTESKQARHLPFKDRNGRVDLTQLRIALDKADKISPVTDSISKEELRSKAKEELEKHKAVLKTAKKEKDESTQGGNTNVKLTEEQKAKIEEIRSELGDFAKEIKDEDLLNEEVVAEIRKEKADKENDNKSDLEKAQEKIAELEAKVEEMKSTLEAKDSEIEEVRANAEKIGQMKVQLKDNEFAKDFSDEDYLDDEKVAKAVQDKKDSETIATRKEELKENEYAKDFKDEDYLNDDKVELAKVKKEKDELEAKNPKDKKEAKAEEKEDDLETGADDKGETSYEKVMASVREQKAQNREGIKVYKRK